MPTLMSDFEKLLGRCRHDGLAGIVAENERRIAELERDNQDLREQHRILSEILESESRVAQAFKEEMHRRLAKGGW